MLATYVSELTFVGCFVVVVVFRLGSKNVEKDTSMFRAKQKQHSSLFLKLIFQYGLSIHNSYQNRSLQESALLIDAVLLICCANPLLDQTRT